MILHQFFCFLHSNEDCIVDFFFLLVLLTLSFYSCLEICIIVFDFS